MNVTLPKRRPAKEKRLKVNDTPVRAPRLHTTLLYVDPSGIATLISGERAATGPLSTLKALSATLKAKGPTLLLTDGELKDTTLPAGLPAKELQPYLDAQQNSLAILAPGQGTERFISLHDKRLVQQARAAARGARLQLTALMPLATATLRATHTTTTAVIINVTASSYETSIYSGRPAAFSRTQARTAEGSTARPLSLAQVISSAVSPLLSSGDRPSVIVVGSPDQPNTLASDVEPLFLSLEEALLGARLPAPAALDEDATVKPHPVSRALQLERPLDAKTALDRKLLASLGVAAAINLGLVVFTQSVQAQVTTLTQTKASLQQQADAVQALRALNDQLAARNTQAKALTQAKGPLAQDLPILARRITALHGHLQSLGGPNVVSPTDTLPFGTRVTRAYDLTAQTQDAQTLTGGFQKNGLAADIHSVDCSKGNCIVELRAAPTDTTAQVTP
ncbi:hypothetical protein [Deinococcus ruber]|uniref:Uncharacterized protein n=1 Tax=Deinococcus ruber TaxID=1848197 RepID=A0A918FDQ3_9DEIO|nr:hypothetical protein [Deinococcus ruber]GGR30588.1 hypothetical protein GCM10008957_46660 [Deinococcus ruber]